jgi:hypothetical protein
MHNQRWHDKRQGAEKSSGASYSGPFLLCPALAGEIIALDITPVKMCFCACKGKVLDFLLKMLEIL